MSEAQTVVLPLIFLSSPHKCISHLSLNGWFINLFPSKNKKLKLLYLRVCFCTGDVTMPVTANQQIIKEKKINKKQNTHIRSSFIGKGEGEQFVSHE